MQGFHLCAIGKQFVGVARRLLVIERLSVGQRIARREDVNPSIHICMDQADELEISGSRKNYSESLPLPHLGCGDASRTIEDGRVTRKARAPHMEIRAHLAGAEKSHGVILVRLPCPGDSVSGVNPDFIGQKSQSLNCLVVGLGADSRGPLRLHHLWKDQKGEEQGPAEAGYKPSPPGFVYVWARRNLFRFGFHSLPFIALKLSFYRASALVVRVLLARGHINLEVPEPAQAIGGEEKRLAVRSDERLLIIERAVHRGAQVDRSRPGIQAGLARGDPKV